MDVGMHRPDWRVEPQPQQVTTRGFRRVAVVESGPRMQDRVVVDEIRFARLSDKDLALIADLLSLDSVNCESTTWSRGELDFIGGWRRI